MKTAKKPWKYLVDNKLRGAYGATDFEKRTIRVNKKRHESIAEDKTIPKKDATLLNTIVHEMLHKAHPAWPEKKIKAAARVRTQKMTEGQKQTLYAKFA